MSYFFIKKYNAKTSGIVATTGSAGEESADAFR